MACMNRFAEAAELQQLLNDILDEIGYQEKLLCCARVDFETKLAAGDFMDRGSGAMVLGTVVKAATDEFANATNGISAVIVLLDERAVAVADQLGL